MRMGFRLRLAIGFLTRIPVGNLLASDEEFARSLAFFPIVGALLGIALAAVASILESQLSPGIVAGLLLAFSALLTGGLHLDGLADVFDGLGGGRGDAERMLNIMRDSRIGSHGAVALIVCLLVKFAALSELIAAKEFLLLGMAPMAARALIVPTILVVPYVRQEGLGSSFQRCASHRDLLPAALCLLCAIVLGGFAAAIAVASAALMYLAVSALLVSKLRGLTGDGYGTLIELGELAFLVALTWG